MSDIVQLAPKKPRKFICPECAANGESQLLRFGNSFSEQWGRVVTRHDIYRCPCCREKFVSTNGREPEIAADWI